MKHTEEVQKLKVFFIRHVDRDGAWDSPDFSNVLDFLHDNQLISVVYDHLESWDPKDYTSPKAASAIRTMQTIRSLGRDAYVIASYTNGNSTRIIGGYPDANSSKYLSNYADGADNKIFKTIKLVDSKAISSEDFPFAHLLAPKFGTVVQWHQCEAQVNDWLSGYKGNPFTPSNYMPDAMEIACEEYLRSQNLLSAKLFCTGRGLKDFDIVGVDGAGRNVFAQVKQRSSAAFSKFEAMAANGAGGTYYWFSDRQTENDQIVVVTLENVLRHLEQKFGVVYLERLMQRK